MAAPVGDMSACLVAAYVYAAIAAARSAGHPADQARAMVSIALPHETNLVEVSVTGCPFVVRDVHIPTVSAERRCPAAVVEGDIGPIGVTFTVCQLRKGNLIVRPPVSGDGQPGVQPSAYLANAVDKIVLAAVQAHPEAMAVLSAPVKARRR